MKYLLLIITLMLVACDGQSSPPAKIAEPQRDALEKAKGVEQTVQQTTEETQKKINEYEGK